VQDRGLASYIAELLGTLLLVFMVTSVVVLYVAPQPNAQFGSDFAVVGLVHAFTLFLLVQLFAGASGAHFNPAVTLAAMALRRMDRLDGVVYMLAQLSGGVAGALLTKAFMVDEGRAADYGAVQVSALLGGSFQGALVEGIGTFILVLVILAVAFNPNARTANSPLAIGLTLGAVVMVIGPLTGGAVNPARWFGPALVGNEFGAVWPYLAGPAAGALLAALVFTRVIRAGEEVARPTPPGPPPAAPSPPRASPTPPAS